MHQDRAEGTPARRRRHADSEIDELDRIRKSKEHLIRAIEEELRNLENPSEDGDYSGLSAASPQVCLHPRIERRYVQPLDQQSRVLRSTPGTESPVASPPRKPAPERRPAQIISREPTELPAPEGAPPQVLRPLAYQLASPPQFHSHPALRAPRPSPLRTGWMPGSSSPVMLPPRLPQTAPPADDSAIRPAAGSDPASLVPHLASGDSHVGNPTTVTFMPATSSGVATCASSTMPRGSPVESSRRPSYQDPSHPALSPLRPPDGAVYAIPKDEMPAPRDSISMEKPSEEIAKFSRVCDNLSLARNRPIRIAQSPSPPPTPLSSSAAAPHVPRTPLSDPLNDAVAPPFHDFPIRSDPETEGWMFRAPRKKAVVVGINYANQHCALRGAVQDALEWKRLLQSFSFDEIRLLSDEFEDGAPVGFSARLPTKENIMGNLQWLFQDAGIGDVLFFAFSGCGAQIPDPLRPLHVENALVPSDFSLAVPSSVAQSGLRQRQRLVPNLIFSDEFHQAIGKLPDGVQAAIVLDAGDASTLVPLCACITKDLSNGSVAYRTRRISEKPSTTHASASLERPWGDLWAAGRSTARSKTLGRVTVYRESGFGGYHEDPIGVMSADPSFIGPAVFAFTACGEGGVAREVAAVDIPRKNPHRGLLSYCLSQVLAAHGDARPSVMDLLLQAAAEAEAVKRRLRVPSLTQSFNCLYAERFRPHTVSFLSHDPPIQSNIAKHLENSTVLPVPLAPTSAALLRPTRSGKLILFLKKATEIQCDEFYGTAQYYVVMTIGRDISSSGPTVKSASESRTSRRWSTKSAIHPQLEDVTFDADLCVNWDDPADPEEITLSLWRYQSPRPDFVGQCVLALSDPRVELLESWPVTNYTGDVKGYLYLKLRSVVGPTPTPVLAGTREGDRPGKGRGSSGASWDFPMAPPARMLVNPHELHHRHLSLPTRRQW